MQSEYLNDIVYTNGICTARVRKSAQLYWNIGNAVLRKQEDNGWGAKVIDRMSKDIRDAFPDMKGFSPRNIKYMRKFAEAWDDFEFVQRVVAQISRRTNIVLLEKLKEKESRA